MFYVKDDMHIPHVLRYSRSNIPIWQKSLPLLKDLLRNYQKRGNFK